MDLTEKERTKAIRNALDKADWSKIPGKELRKDIKWELYLLCDSIDEKQKQINKLNKEIKEARNQIHKKCKDWGL